jgi:predicted RNase H-like HicB family nuclease
MQLIVSLLACARELRLLSLFVRWLSLRSFSSPAERHRIRHMNFRVEIEQEEDGRWIAEVVDLPGVLAYGSTSKEAQAKVQALALRVLADRLEHGEAGPDLLSISFATA